MKKMLMLCAGIALSGTVLAGTPKGGPIDTIDHRHHHGGRHWCPPPPPPPPPHHHHGWCPHDPSGRWRGGLRPVDIPPPPPPPPRRWGW